MVFESYVVSILNKFLGQYVENLDASQFQMSIWGGDVKLENLVLKENALDELDLPVKVLRGHLGQLILKIPWKNLYSEPVVAKVDGVYLLARPNTDIQYDAEKEEKIKQEKKQQELTAIEEAIKYAEEAKNKTEEDKEKSLSFVEKLAMHIVKNIQVFVSNIHIRYEDTVSNEDGPFSIGITLESLSAESVDDNWQPVVVDSKQDLVNKLVKLDNLALYLNSHDKIGTLPTAADWVNIAKAGIAKGDFGDKRPENYTYIIEPLTSETKAKLDTSSVPNLSIPKVFVEIIMKELGLVLSQRQFKDIMRLADNFDRMKTNSQFRKYKPFVPLKENRKAWWNYAIQSVLEDDVRRRSRNWSWKHIIEHRLRCQKYMLLYKQKLSQKNVSDKVQKDIEKYEDALDVLNITIWRKQAEIETKKEGTNYELNEQRKKSEGGGWFSGFFGKKSKDKKEVAGLTKEEEAVEEQKLYAAIGYSESDAPVKLPPEYVAYKLKFAQKRISLRFQDDSVEPACCVSSVSLEELFMELGYRPGAQAVSVLTKLGNFKVLGCSVENQSAPLLVRSVAENADIAEYVNASFETNPLDGKCDQRIKLNVQPLEVIYHAVTVDHLMKFFQLPEDVQLSEISAAAYSQIDGIRNQSRTNLSYAIETRTLMDIDILVHSPFVIIPEKGILTDNCSMLVVDLGSLKVSSDPTQERITNTKSMTPEELEEKVYDRFDIELKQLQILLVKPGEDWKDSRNETHSSQHVLNPFGLSIQLHKCLAADDVRLAQIRIAGVLKTLQLHVTDKKLDDLMKLALTIPIPGEQDAGTVAKPSTTQSVHRQVKTEAYIFPLDVAVKEETSDDAFQTPPESPEEGSIDPPRFPSIENEEAMKLAKVRQVNVALKFEIVQINVTVSTQDQFGIESPLLDVGLLKLGTQVSVRQYDLTVMANIGDIVVKEMIHGIDGAPLELVSTPSLLDILAFKFVQADKSHPRFEEDFHSTEKAIDVNFASLKVVLHQEALLNLMEFANNLLPASEEEIVPQQQEQLEGSSEPGHEKEGEDERALAKKKTQGDEVIEVKVDARLGELTVAITSVNGEVAQLQMKQLQAGVSMLSDRITVLARMQDFSVLDGVVDALYPKIVTIVNEEVFNIEVVIFNNATEGGNYSNMDKVDTKFMMNVGRIQVVFLNRFVSNLLAFVNNFQRAQEAIQNASKTAAQTASQSLQEYNKNSPRVKLDVSIQAPLVIVPVNSRSERALVANLGNLEVHNNFKIVQGGVGEDTAVVDNMAVSFTSLQLSVAIISKDGAKIVTQRLILKPISLELTLARSLSSWYHGIPDIDVTGQLHAVNINIGTDDLKTALAITSQNLTEGATVGGDIEEAITSSSESSLAVMDSPDEEVSEVVPDEEKTWVAVKFLFSIETIAARIYKNIKQLDANDKSTWEHPAENCLSHFSLDHFNLAGSMLANGAMETSVVLQTISLDDQRPALEKGITTMIERRADDKAPQSDASNMIDVQFKQTKELDKKIVVLVKGMSIIVNVEFLMVLSTVFTDALEEAPQEPGTETEILAEARMVSTDLASSSTAPPTTANHNPVLDVSLQVEEPEIFLLADAKQKNTNALIVKNTLDVSLKIREEQIWFQSTIQNLHVVTAAFEKHRRQISQADVLRVQHISFHLSSMIGGRPHIDLNTSVAYLNVSPAFVGIATAVATSLTPSKDEDGEGKNEDVPDLFKAVDIVDSRKWYLQEVARGQLVAGSRVFARAADLKSYAPGLCTIIDKKIEVILDDGASWSCDVNDVRGVVLDEPPLAKEIVVGTKVIALVKEGEPMKAGVVTKIVESSDKASVNVLVRFSAEEEDTKPLEYIRLLRSVKNGAPHNKPVISSAVWARLPDNEHYNLGFISKKDWRYQVKFANGTSMYHFVNDPLAIVLDRSSRPEHVTVGLNVIAPIPNKPMMYPGRVKKIAFSGYEIQFDNGAVHEVSVHDIKLMKVPKKEGHRLTVRSLLWIKYTDNFYYRGYIDAIDNKIYVRFYEHEERVSFPLNERARLVRDVTPKEVQIGESVVVLKGTYGIQGVVTKIEFRESDPVYLIEGAGNESWVPLKDIRRFGKTIRGSGQELASKEVENISDNREEQLVVHVDGFVFNVEGEKGGNLISLVNMRGKLSAEVKNWQEKLSGKADLRLEANYFNEELSEWEPLIEKLETKDGFRSWELSVAFKMNQDDTLDDSGSQMIVSIESHDILELTITKTNLDVFSELGKSFSEAVTESIGGSSLALEQSAPYEIKNELGVDIGIRPGKTFKPPENTKGEVVVVHSGESLLLHFARHLRLASTSSDVESVKIAVEVEGYHELRDISVKEASCAFFNIVPKKLHKQGFRSMVVQVTSPDGRKLVVLRSPFRMKNHCLVPLEIFVQSESLKQLDTLKQDEYLNIPLSIANNDLGYFIKPGGFPYEKTVEEIRLSQISKNGRKLFACAAPWADADPFYVQVRCVTERYTKESGSRSNQPCYTLHYHPPVVLMNYLPFPIQFSQEGVGTLVNLEGGNKLPIYTVDLDRKPALSIKVESYLGNTYTGQMRLRNDLAQLSVLYLVSGTKRLVVGVYVKKGGSLELTLYSTYWLINHTGLQLEYKALDSDTTIKHPPNETEVAIFAFTSKPDMFSKNTLRLRTSGSGWSDQFSLDTAGSGGSLKCKKDGKEYGIGSEIRLSYFSLTKIVVFTPLNLLVNHTQHTISLSEVEGVWYTAKSGETIPFWPNKTPAKNLKIKTDDSPAESIAFDFRSNVNLLLRLDNEVGGLCVTMFSKDAATVMTFTPYFEGSAPLRLDNDSSFEICYRQVNSDKVHVLPPKKTTVFTWDNLQGKLELEWFILGQEKLSAKSNLEKNDMGTLGEKAKPLCHWASFLDGLQRVLYFTQSYTMAFRARQDQLEIPSQEVTLSLKGIGLSLVNNKKSLELAYMSISPSNVLWEEQKNRRRWKTMTTKVCDALEAAFQTLQAEVERGENVVHRRKVDNMKVDFETMEIIEPDRRPIRRTFHPGVWVQFNQSTHEIQLHSKINDIQMDSQIPGSTFQTLFHSIPPPKTVAASNAPKPMIEGSMITRKEENAIVTRIKYFKVLVQELDVKMDKGWLLELVALFGTENQALDESNYEEDKKVITTSLQSLNAAVTDVRNYYDYFHLSPIKVHVSFSVQGGGSGQQTNVGGNVVDLLLNSLGVAVADVQDVVLKLAYFELKNQIYSQSQLIQVATNHYTSQAIKQAYVLVLGLDVLGNPFGLITGLTTGAKDLFYEPYQGLIQGPEEFAEGLALGVKSLVGHTIGGAAGAVSRITGTLGKGIAALTMDDEYQQSRRTAMSKKPTSVKEGLSRGGKGLLEGVFEGVTGVVTKPMEGAKKSGAKGFFKGMGKGLVGVVAKPVSGVVDFASSTLEGIKGTASGDRAIKRLRPPRRFYADKIMRPYNLYDAQGVEFLKTYSKGKETLSTDSYVSHYFLPNNMAIMVTNKHVLLMKKETVIKNEWENFWFCKLKDLQADPKVNGTKITFTTPEEGKIFKKTGSRVVDLKSASAAEWIAKTAVDAKALLK